MGYHPLQSQTADSHTLSRFSGTPFQMSLIVSMTLFLISCVASIAGGTVGQNTTSFGSEETHIPEQHHLLTY